jgi:uncharacterized protein (DUF302 family)
MIPYGLFREVTLPFETVLKKIPVELHRKGFDVISNVRIDNELKKNIGVEFKRYAILGVCNLPLSYKALTKDDSFGLVLSCTIVIYEKTNATVVGTIRPTQFLPFLQNEQLADGASVIEKKLAEVLDVLGTKRFLKENKKGSQKSDIEQAIA